MQLQIALPDSQGLSAIDRVLLGTVVSVQCDYCLVLERLLLGANLSHNNKLSTQTTNYLLRQQIIY